MIGEKFRELDGEEEGAYMPHIYYGDPSESFSIKEVEALEESGADILEFGIPFSDPTADGPTFQEACERALENGITPNKCLDGLKKLRKNGLKIPIVVTTYFNIPHVFGIDNFFKKLDEVNAQAVIIPNIPVEESDSILPPAQKNGIDVIFQVTPNTSEKRIEKIAEKSSGFIYIVNVEGVTGARESVSDSTSKLINRVRKKTDLPLMAGFGVSKRKHSEALVSAGADGVITGSALGEIYNQNLENPEEKLSEIRDFAGNIKQGCIAGYKNRK